MVGPVTAEGIPTEGHLGDVPLSTLLRTLAKSAGGGILHLQGSYASIVCFHEGDIYLAHSESGPSLLQVVTGAGVVSREGWEKAATQLRDGGTLADALLSVGGAEPDVLRAALEQHTVSTLFELLVPSTATFRFAEGETHQLGPRFVFPVEAVLAAAGERLQEFKQIAKAIPSTSVVMAVSPSLPVGVTGISLTAVEWQVLAAVDGKRTIAEITASVGQSAFSVFSALHRLLTAGAIHPLS
jgi:hypothetical protein